MTALRKLMTAEEFYAWVEDKPEKWELFHGMPVAMSPERAVHMRAKYRLTKALEASIAKTGLPCHAMIDGLAVRIDEHNSYQPDAMVHCGDEVPDDAQRVPDPIIVVEVLSPSSEARDLRHKLVGYFRIPSVQHYVIVDTDERLVIHHKRASGDTVITRVVSDGDIALEPPGITLTLTAILGPASQL